MILLVEDNAVNQMVAVHQLESLGFAAHVVANGVEAIAALALIHYDLVLMDCHMSEMDGFETTRQIREMKDAKANIPIIALTANAMGKDKEDCLAAGMTDYLSKPIDMDQLDEMLSKYLGLKKVA